MVIHDSVTIQEFRCPRCGNKYFPGGINAPVITCPVIGCNQVIDPNNMPLVHDDPTMNSFDPTAVQTQANGAINPLLYDRNEHGDMIVKGVYGDPETVEIPALMNGRAVMGIAPGAFEGKKELRRVTLPDTVAVIGQNAFANCTALEEITFGAGLTLLDKGCLSGCRRLDCVKLPAKVREIGSSAFQGCTGLLHLIVEGGVEVIRDNAFLDCARLRRITFARPASRVADSAFAGCYDLADETVLAFCPEDA